MSSSDTSYLGNPLLKKAGTPHNYTQEEIAEYIKCSKNVEYFTENYVKIIHVDFGLISLKLFKFQKKIIKTISKNRFTIAKLPRQSGKSTTIIAYFLHYILFNEDVNVAILANKGETSRELLGRLQLAYENLPIFLQQGIKVWNKGDIHLENGSKIVAASTSSNAIRGRTYNCISGDSVIHLRNEDTKEEIDINIEDLYDVANSSRNINIAKYNHEYNKQQIQDLVLFSDDESSKSRNIIQHSNRKSSYNTTFNERGKHQIKFSVTHDQGTFAGSQIIAEIFDGDGEIQNDPCLLYNENGTTGNVKSSILKRTTDIIQTIFRGSKNNENWKKTLRGNQEKNLPIEYGEKNKRRIPKESEYCQYRKITWIQKIRGILSKGFSWINWKEKNKNSRGSDQQESRENSQDSRKASWNEKIGRIQKENERSSEKTNTESWGSLEQGLNKGRWKIYTEKGYKAFRGISKTQNQNTINITTCNKNNIRCTVDHQIATTPTTFVLANTLNIGDKIYTNIGLDIIVDIKNEIPCDVYDLIDVEDVHSFFANDILVHNCILLDEFAFVPRHVAEDFFSSVYPTITSGTTTKMIIVSTPCGMNHFYKLWTDAVNKKNNYIPIEANWNDVPGRDENWRHETIKNIGQERWDQEFNCSFIGSVNTLINSTKLKAMPFGDPIEIRGDLDIFISPKPHHIYCLVADVSHGEGLDYSAFSIFDCGQFPYEQVAKYRSSNISPMAYPTVIQSAALAYNSAYVLVETNDVGQQVVDILHHDLEYDNLLTITQRGRAGQVLGSGFGVGQTSFGIKTSKKVKQIGCMNLKNLVEADRFMIQDFDTISELTCFVSKGYTYEAESGHNDDLVMTLVLFSWLTTQPHFKSLTNVDARIKMVEDRINIIRNQEEEDYQKELQNLVPFGIIDTGPSFDDEIIVDRGDNTWMWTKEELAEGIILDDDW